MKTPIIRQEAGQTWIENVPALGWGRGKECTFIGALEAALAPTATPYSYEDLMGWSALAFRVRWYQGDTGPRWCPSSPVGEFPDELAALRRATGWELRGEFFPDEATGHLARFAPEIAASIREGRPVLAYEPRMNMDVIYGYEDEGRTVLLRDWFETDQPLRRKLDELGPMIVFLGRREGGLSAHDALIAGVTLGVEHWHRSHEAGERGRYWYGRAAFAKWHDDLARIDGLTREELERLFFVNWWVFDSLLDARAAAATFLRRNAPLLHGSPHRHALEAARRYEDELLLLRGACHDKQMFLGPWTGRGLADWTPAVRECERSLLHRCLGIESAAIGELENLLEALSPEETPELLAGVH